MNKIRAERFVAVRKASEDQKKENFGGIYFTDKGKKAHLNVLAGDTLRLCGVTTRYDADYEIGTCTSIQTSASVSGTTISNMIKIDLVGNTGTSGGPIMVYDSDTDAYRLIGMCSAQGNNCVYGANINYVMNSYNLSILPEGSITV